MKLCGEGELDKFDKVVCRRPGQCLHLVVILEDINNVKVGFCSLLVFIRDRLSVVY